MKIISKSLAAYNTAYAITNSVINTAYAIANKENSEVAYAIANSITEHAKKLFVKYEQAYSRECANRDN